MGEHANVARRLESEEKLDDQVAHERETPRRRLNRSCLTPQLVHGDLVIQSGKEIQRDWQHSMKVKGLRIGQSTFYACS
ncbi:hypothetical protein CROQUDRAFT_652233 [Cronartium quercuum f. sp. fusiforme G11]|uniref:Uncharacterized protein n=1 Tax=Cronartium quercuum f. sp. fusiforme G11 TaxID=708437 RepID=A0A9P6NR21_9BASI|nr:hypothetical protein CROQUDRAFT_652233 [Cronartium quercuum f. sp. fusiforme G11]